MKDRTHASVSTRADFIVRPLVLGRRAPAGHATVTGISPEGLRCIPDPLVFDAGDFRPGTSVILLGSRGPYRELKILGTVGRALGEDGSVEIRILSTTNDASLQRWIEKGRL